MGWSALTQQRLRVRRYCGPRSALSQVAMIGFDLAKSSVDFAGLDAAGQVVTRRRYTKARLVEVTAKLHPYRIGMEACCGAHHLGRVLLSQGHDLKLMPPTT